MYEDYPTIYETNSDLTIFYYSFFGSLIVISIVLSFCLSKIFKKANRSSISAWIPLYNLNVLLEIVNLSKFYFVLLLIPFINIYALYKIMMGLAKFFRKSKLFGLGLFILPIVYIPILAFDESEYMGINIDAMNGKTKVMATTNTSTENKVERTVNEDIDIASKGIGISIGGGVYQKDYTKDLLNVDEQAIIEDKKQEEVKPIQPQIEIKEEPNSSQIPINIPNMITEEVKPTPFVNIISEVEAKPVPSVIPEMKEPAVTKPLTKSLNQEIVSTPKINLDQTITCPKCGTKLKPGVKTCFLCGQNLN